MLNSEEVGEETVFGLGEVDYSQGLPTMGSDPGPITTKGPSQYPATADESVDHIEQVKILFMGPYERGLGLGEVAFGATVLALGIITWKYTSGWVKVLNALAIAGGAGRVLGGALMVINK